MCDNPCPWAARKRFVVNPDGQVHPCCYFANSDYTGRNRGEHFKEYDHQVYKSYDAKRDQMNVNNRPAHEILQDPWFDELFESLLDSDLTHPTCRKRCGINSLHGPQPDVI